jgi:hypothetical protein
MKDPFSAYVYLPPTTPFSFLYFATLNLRNTPEVLTSCPQVLPANSLVAVSFSFKEAPSPVSHTPSLNEYVPHFGDLLPYVGEVTLREKYTEGYRSLNITYRKPEETQISKVQVHFAQVSQSASSPQSFLSQLTPTARSPYSGL